MKKTTPDPRADLGPIQKNLNAAQGKTDAKSAHVHNPGAADEIPGEHTARGQYGLTENLDAEDFYAASNKHPDDPEVESLK